MAVASDGLLGVWECFSDPCYYDMWAVRRTHERGWGECFHINSAEEAKALTALLNHAAKLAEAVNEASRCFYGPEEQKPGTWGWEVAAKLHALSSPNKRETAQTTLFT